MSFKRQIFAIGNNTFYADGTNIHLFQKILKASGQATPRVLLIPTASGDQESTVAAFEKCFSPLTPHVSHLSLFRGQNPDFEGIILNQDVIYVSGGNTRNMLLLWKEWGIDALIRKAYEQGVVLAGGSAGSLCWFEEGVTDSLPGRLTAMKCLGILKGSNCPHYDGEVNRRPIFHQLLQSKALDSGYANEDGVALHFVNEVFTQALSAYPNKAAYRVDVVDGQVKETKISAIY